MYFLTIAEVKPWIPDQVRNDIIGKVFTESSHQALQKYDLTRAEECNTLLDMKSATLTIRLDKDLDVLLSKASKRSGRNRSEIAREALRRQLRLQQFEELRKRIMPFAEARGFLTDEDIFSKIS